MAALGSHRQTCAPPSPVWKISGLCCDSTRRLFVTLSVYYKAICYTLSILQGYLLHSQYTTGPFVTLSVYYKAICYTLSILQGYLLHSQYTTRLFVTLVEAINTYLLYNEVSGGSFKIRISLAAITILNFVRVSKGLFCTLRDVYTANSGESDVMQLHKDTHMDRHKCIRCFNVTYMCIVYDTALLLLTHFKGNPLNN